jgi:glutathione S-transferase
MKLYYAETLNPRKVCAVARHLGAALDYVHVDLPRGEHRRPEFLALNPNARVPVLEEDDGRTLWESTAIMCRLSDAAGADLWPHDARQIDCLRWLAWDLQHFTRHAGVLWFEHLIKPRLGLGEPDRAAIEAASAQLRSSAGVLDAHLRSRAFLLGERLSVADFATAVTLPYAGAARLPLDDFPSLRRWHERLCELPGWLSPFPEAAQRRAFSPRAAT